MKDNKQLCESVQHFMNQQDTVLDGLQKVLDISKKYSFFETPYKVSDAEVKRLEAYISDMKGAVTTAHHLVENLVAAYEKAKAEEDAKKKEAAEARKKAKEEKEVAKDSSIAPAKAQEPENENFEFDFD